MAYGVMFHVEKDYPASSEKFRKLLKAINAEEFIWKIDESDFYNLDNFQNILEKKQIIQGSDIIEELNCNLMMIWIAIEGYKNKSDITNPSNSFQKYLESSCEIVVFVVDTYQFTIYTKNPETLKKAIDFAQKNSTGTYELIEKEHADWYFGV